MRDEQLPADAVLAARRIGAYVRQTPLDASWWFSRRTGANVAADVLDPEVASALTGDAAAITNLAAGEVSEGSLARAFRDPDDPDLRAGLGPVRTRQVAFVTLVVTAVVASFGILGAAAVAVVAGVRAMIRSATRGA